VTTVLELVDITKRFPGVLANNRICLDLAAGEVHSLLGENGAGKTTLMNILYGLLRPDEGEIRLRGKRCSIDSPRRAIAQGVGMVHQHFMLVPTFTAAENVVLGQELMRGPFLNKREAARRMAKLSEDYCLNVDPHVPVWQLSVGEQQRVEILKLLYRGAEILVLDEPTASLTPLETESFFQVLRSLTERAKSVIFISHKLDEVMGISDRITVLRRGRAVGTVRRGEAGEKDLARLMVGRDVVLRVSGEHRAHAQEAPAASLRDLSALGSHGTPALHGVTLDLFRGEILGVAGVDGNGQTELAEVLAGLRAPSGGVLRIGDREAPPADPLRRIELGIYYVPAERKRRGAVMGLPIAMSSILKSHHTAPVSRHGILSHRAIRTQAQEQIRAYDVRCSSPKALADTLSGGNLQKLILAREISAEPRILIAEQPTRGLDVGAIEYVRGLLLKQRERGCAVLLISADLDEVLALSDRVVVLYRGKVVYHAENHGDLREEVGLAMGGVSCG